ncbi:hypothetical protein E0I03_10975 [Dickeya dadantii]|nr:hypothetical protein [Dickeya dadantii]
MISPCIAVTIKPALLSPHSLTLSIASITSCGIRTVVICDFAFFAPVAITASPLVWCMSVYRKKCVVKGLTCISPKPKVKYTLCRFGRKIAKPDCAGTLVRPLTTNVTEINAMADKQSTQTHAKFTRAAHITHAEEAVTQVVYAMSIIRLIAAQDVGGPVVENALDAVIEILEKAETELVEVCRG